MILGNIQQRTRIFSLADTKNLSHAFLLSGPEGTGKYDFLLELSHYLLSSSHALPPDMIKVDALYLDGQTKDEDIISSTFDQSHRKKTKKKTDTIGVDDVESFTKHLYETSYKPYKIVLIRNIERLTHEASNTFLKVLEEPPEKTLFLMTTSEEFKILPTIFSRVQRHFFSLASDTELSMGFFGDEPIQKKQWILRLAAGRSRYFTKLLKDELFFEAKKSEWCFFESFAEQPLVNRFKKAEELAKESIEYIVLFLDTYIMVLRSYLEIGLRSHETSIFASVHRMVSLLETAKKDILANGNKRLVLENTFLGL